MLIFEKLALKTENEDLKKQNIWLGEQLCRFNQEKFVEKWLPSKISLQERQALKGIFLVDVYLEKVIYYSPIVCSKRIGLYAVF